MKRILAVVFSVSIAGSAIAADKLRIIDLSNDAPASNAKPNELFKSQAKPAEAADFLKRLTAKTEAGIERSQTGKMTAIEARNQAIALNTLKDESDRFGAVFTPFHKCREAAIDAATSWQGFIGGNETQFVDSYKSYLAGADECGKAIKVAQLHN